jgi:hypothetical protein
MFGENRQLITRICPCCKKHVAMRVDLDDMRRHEQDGVFVQFAFADRHGVPYLGPGELEMFLTVCPDCWDLLCVDPIAHPTFYN